MIASFSYNTKKSVKPLKVTVEVQRITRETALKYSTVDDATRNDRCTHGKPCSQFGKRPCCPPVCPMFRKMKERAYLYLIAVSMDTEEYLDSFPNTKAQGAHDYFAMVGTHKLTRYWANSLVDNLIMKGEQGFKVWGCTGCITGKCDKCMKDYRPALEGVGFHVVDLYKDIFGKEIEWYSKSKMMTNMVAVVGVYTDRSISKAEVEKLLSEITPG